MKIKNPWTILSSEIKYENPWIKVTENQVLNPKGGPGIYGVVHFKNIAIGIIPMDSEGYIWLVGQYRFPLEEYSWEIPEGGGHPDIDPLESAKRELLEETGIQANTWKNILTMHLSNSVSDEIGYVFLATDLSFGQAMPEETEELEIQKIHIEEAFQMVCEAKITDSLSVAGILRLKTMI